MIVVVKQTIIKSGKLKCMTGSTLKSSKNNSWLNRTLQLNGEGVQLSRLLNVCLPRDRLWLCLPVVDKDEMFFLLDA